MILDFSDRQLEVRLPEGDLEVDDLFVKETGRDVVGQDPDLPAAIQAATSLPMDVVLAEFGRAFPPAAERFGGVSGELYLHPAPQTPPSSGLAPC
jgi:hypothetical protein